MKIIQAGKVYIRDLYIRFRNHQWWRLTVDNTHNMYALNGKTSFISFKCSTSIMYKYDKRIDENGFYFGRFQMAYRKKSRWSYGKKIAYFCDTTLYLIFFNLVWFSELCSVSLQVLGCFLAKAKYGWQIVAYVSCTPW